MQITANVDSISNPDYYLENGDVCIFRIKSGSSISHYVLVYDIDTSKTGTDRYLVADPDGGTFRTLTQAIQRRGLPANMSYITQKFVIR